MISEFVDEDSWVRIRDRMRRANFVIGGLMAGLCRALDDPVETWRV